jgi:formylglycine-generating enzyme required for sulfatase activity
MKILALKWITTVTLLAVLVPVGAFASHAQPVTAEPAPSRSVTFSEQVYAPLIRYEEYIPPPDMILIPAGTFQMGCDPAHNAGIECRADELPLHSVYLDAYRMDRTEVTNVQYRACVQAGECTEPMRLVDDLARDYYPNRLYNFYPVIRVTRSQAEAFCMWAGKRLPTEAQWEKAARGADPIRTYPWGDETPDCSHANYNAYTYGCLAGTNSVGSYPQGASPYGVMDMAGNVAEWVSDWWSDAYYASSPRDNPTGPATGTFGVVRGGGWRMTRSDLRTSGRTGWAPDFDYGELGFRCAAAVGK